MFSLLKGNSIGNMDIFYSAGVDLVTFGLFETPFIIQHLEAEIEDVKSEDLFHWGTLTTLNRLTLWFTSSSETCQKMID